jgi:hypothetical protein
MLRGLTYYDEGYILNAALRTAHGQIPYKDFDMVYTPISFVYTAGFLKVFGESVLSERLGVLVLTFFSLTAIVILIRKFTKNIWLIALSVLFFIAWGPTHLNFAWPVMFAACFLLYATLFYLLGIKRNSKKFFFLTGLMTVLVFLSKQNFGAGVFVVFLIALIFLKSANKKIFLKHYLLGVISLSTIYFLYLLITSSLLPFIQNMYLYTLKRVVLDKGLDTPFLYEGSFIARVAKLIFYTLPLTISIACSWIVYKRDKNMLFIPLLIIIFYLLGVRPTTDYVHVTPLIALSFLPLLVLYKYSKKLLIKASVIILLIILTFVGFYTAYYKGYYQWEASMNDYTYFSENSKLHIYLKKEQSVDATALQKYVDNKVGKNDYIFVNYYTPLVYFITDRENPTPYDLISTNQLPDSYQQNIIRILQQKKVKLVMLHEINKNENSIVSNYIRKHYHHTKTIAGFVIFEK